MGAVTLRAIDRDNWETCIQLAVAKDQQSFVASNLYSLAQAFVWPECVPLGIFEEDTMVGFLMWAKDHRDGQYWVYRLMIDHRFQNAALPAGQCGPSWKISAARRTSSYCASPSSQRTREQRPCIGNWASARRDRCWTAREFWSGRLTGNRSDEYPESR